MKLRREQWPVVIVYAILVIIFAFVFIARKNYEFLGYVGVILLLGWIIVYTNDKINYPNGLLWGLLLWALMHMAGGGVFIGGKKLYGLILIPLVGEPYNIFRYDQLVHIIGFGFATYAMYVLLKPSLKEYRWISLSIVVIMAGLGAGALNEIIEFLATVFAPETGVGGYINNSLDLVSNGVGAGIAMFWIYRKERNSAIK
jgi:hypothetical protein